MLIILSVLGFLVSYYIWNKAHRKKEKLVCVIGNDCNKVVHSKYSKILGIDNTILGMFYYSFIFIIGLLQFFFPVFFILSSIIIGKLVISGTAVLYSIYLMFIQLRILRDVCEYCLVANTINLLIFVVILI